ncbi:hypothetical protein [Microbacterium alcoholitolerans]|uniref:hypothetical protein n=1 Tax=unclassified Microbacterium TaxID=2609290 RepID=UPI003D164ADD
MVDKTRLVAQPADIHHTAKAHRDMLKAARSGDVHAYRKAVIEHYDPLQRVLANAE